MKKTTRKVAVLLLLGGMLCQAQETPDVKKALITAQLQLQKSSRSYNPETAIATYNQLAAQGNAQAMNALGLIYSKGMSVPVDDVLGIQWFEKAGEAGYAKAWYNLGLLFRESNPAKAIPYFQKAAIGGIPVAYAAWGRLVMKGNGIPQDYPLAISIFKQGAEKGNAYCNYILGYLLYKGFGCTQDYNQAIEQFEIAAQKNNAWAMYMLGLCYRNGYGVPIDKEKAKLWLTKSAAMGVKPSQIELADPQAENPNQVITISKPIAEVITITETNAPETFQRVKQTPITTPISGNYTGHIVRYDWSGQNNISSTPLEIELNQDGKELTGKWKETNGDTTPFTAQIEENGIIFKNSNIDRTEHFYKGSLNTYEFREAQLQLLQTDESLFLIGNLQLFNIKERENEKPMYLILEKKQVKTTEVPEIISSVVIHPNPVVNDFNLSFNLAQAADVTMNIYYMTGRELYSEQWKNLQQGTQTKTLALNAPSGYYLLRLTYGNEVKTTLLIKK